MKVLIADKLSDKAVCDLENLGAEVVVKPDLTADDLGGALGDAEILVVRSTKVKAPAIEAGPCLSLIIRAGAGVNTIDLDCASSKGIYVANCPGKNTEAVAELAIGLLIASDRRIVNAGSDMRSGAWKKKEYGKARGLKGRTLGIIGVGTIGKAVIKRTRQGIGNECDSLVAEPDRRKGRRAWNRILCQCRASCSTRRRRQCSFGGQSQNRALHRKKIPQAYEGWRNSC
jgi:phosphoglycerate dehydrogenase-like enzyme